MRIAFISTIASSPWGGSEELWYQSAIEAINRGWQIGLFVYDFPEEAPKIRQLREKGAAVYTRKHKTSLIGRGIERFTGKFPKALNPYRPLLEFNPDLVIVTDAATYYTANDRKLSDTLLNYFREKYVIICQSNSDYHLPADRDFAVRLFENALRVAFVSEGNRRMTFHQLAFRLSKSMLIQNPLLLDMKEEIPFPPMNGIIHCALVGRLCISDKGQDILISILSDEYFKDQPIQFHLYGKGNDRDYLERLIGYYNLGDRVFIEGFTDNRKSVWEKCHCLLMCSHSEGTPLTLLEAMIAGRPCLVTDVGGNEEWIQDGVNGFLVPAPTRKIFSAKLKEAISRRSEWERIGKAARDSALSKMDFNPGKTLIDQMMKVGIMEKSIEQSIGKSFKLY